MPGPLVHSSSSLARTRPETGRFQPGAGPSAALSGKAHCIPGAELRISQVRAMKDGPRQLTAAWSHAQGFCLRSISMLNAAGHSRSSRQVLSAELALNHVFDVHGPGPEDPGPKRRLAAAPWPCRSQPAQTKEPGFMSQPGHIPGATLASAIKRAGHERPPGYPDRTAREPPSEHGCHAHGDLSKRFATLKFCHYRYLECSFVAPPRLFDMKMGLTHIDATSPLCDSCF